MFRPQLFRKTLLCASIASVGLAFAVSAQVTSPADQTLSPDHGINWPWPGRTTPQDAVRTATPIKHLVVIFGENRSFDHYFGTYPVAQNPPGEPVFTAKRSTPAVEGLTPALLTHNPNALNPVNGVNAVNPFRLDRTQANTEGQNHSYTPEQLAYDNGAADRFPAYTGNNTVSSTGTFGTNGLVMAYFDGNTVTAMWNYAQHFALNDNAYTDTFGPSTPGALEVVSGTTNGAQAIVGSASTVPDTQGGLTLIGDTDPAYDSCSSTSSTARMTSKNIGDLLNANNLTWGGFMGGFDLTATNSNGTTGCARSTYSSVLAATKTDYTPHHNWFQYYASTANASHARPSSISKIGYTDPKDSSATPVHHEYDVNDFFSAVSAGNFPSVSYLKAPAVDDAHPGNSDPLDEQEFVVKVINFLEHQPDWKDTAVIITYDDSDGWYDHRYASPTTASFDSTTPEGSVTGADQLNGSGKCTGPNAKPGIGVHGGVVNGRCGPGTRVPFLVISPYARVNYVDDTRITQSSVVRFIEDNWLGGQRIGQGSNDATAGSIMGMFDFRRNPFDLARPLFLDPNQGTVIAKHTDPRWP
ncbi:alkaline phosphatase family protein [Rhodanobacter sp. A1T4]|jgi:phospholipase C|uniref:phospholipase C n=1 Tax=Rhodanobacter sp. A1T4 TaxID=2723087 RepID=UPI001613FA4B|nr:alkaline phosphatase family protein [Rhodanobacter sp. A1T4]MBB6248935.1 phospholipase C [Rhodanobacter sp. A1T4]